MISSPRRHLVKRGQTHPIIYKAFFLSGLPFVCYSFVFLVDEYWFSHFWLFFLALLLHRSFVYRRAPPAVAFCISGHAPHLFASHFVACFSPLTFLPIFHPAFRPSFFSHFPSLFWLSDTPLFVALCCSLLPLSFTLFYRPSLSTLRYTPHFVPFSFALLIFPHSLFWFSDKLLTLGLCHSILVLSVLTHSVPSLFWLSDKPLTFAPQFRAFRHAFLPLSLSFTPLPCPILLTYCRVYTPRFFPSILYLLSLVVPCLSLVLEFSFASLF